MKPVIVQNLIKKMQDRISTLPEPTADTDSEPKRRDRTTSILIAVVIIAAVLIFLI